MSKQAKGIIVILCIVLGIILIFSTKSIAGTLSIRSSVSTVEPGSTYTVTITGDNSTGRVNLSASNATLSQSSVWVEDGSVTVTVTAGAEGTATITASGELADSTTAEEAFLSSSTSVTVKRQEVVVTPTEVAPPTNNNTNNNTNSSKTNSSNNQKKKETKKEEEVIESPFGIVSLYIKGITEDKEEVELILDKEFHINTYEYTVLLGANVEKLEIIAEANEYNECIQIEGADELKPGENIVTVKLVKEGQEEVCYTIIAIKEILEEETLEIEEVVEEMKKETYKVSIPIVWFVVIEVVIVGITATGTYFATKISLEKRKH